MTGLSGSFHQGPGGPPGYLATAHVLLVPESFICPPGGCGASGSTIGQNAIFTEPDFGTVGVRASDANTSVLYWGSGVRSIHGSGNESENRGWNADGTKFFVQVDGTTQLPAFFNPQTMHVTWILCGTGSTGCTNKHPNVTYSWWDATNPNLLYGNQNTAPTILSWDFSACSDPGNVNSVSCTVTQSLSPLYNWNNCPGLSTHGGWNTNNQGVYISAMDMTDNNFATLMGVGAAQDVDYIVAVWNKAKGCLWLNTHTFVMGGDTDAAHWNVNGGVAAGTPITAVGYQPAPAPPAPSLSQTTGGSLALGPYTFGVTYTNDWTAQARGGGESLPGSSTITLTGSNNAIGFAAPSGPAPVNGNPPMDWAGSYVGYNIYACSGTSCSPTWQPGDPTLTVSGFSVKPGPAGSTTYDYTIIPFSATKMGVPVHVQVTGVQARPGSGSWSGNVLSWTGVSTGVTGCIIVNDDMTARTTSVRGLSLNYACGTSTSYTDNQVTTYNWKATQLESVKSTSGTFTLASLTTGLAPAPTSTTDTPNGSLGGGIHQIVFNHDGSWLLARAGSRIFWQLGTPNIVQCDGDPNSSNGWPYPDTSGCSGHEAFGATYHYGRSGGDPLGRLNDGNLLTGRHLDAAFLSNPYTANFIELPGSHSAYYGTPREQYVEDAHPTTESLENSGTIFFTSFNPLGNSYTQGYTDARSIVRAWDREFYGMSQAYPPNAYRFAHDRNTGMATVAAGNNSSGQATGCSSNYFDCGFLTVSRDGRFAIVFSSWDYMLGCQNGTSTCTAPFFDAYGTLTSGGTGDTARIDAFIYKLH